MHGLAFSRHRSRCQRERKHRPTKKFPKRAATMAKTAISLRRPTVLIASIVTLDADLFTTGWSTYIARKLVEKRSITSTTSPKPPLYL